jgi:pyrimidine operon attenuation protein/uracil phosphoribosyltransferase
VASGGAWLAERLKKDLGMNEDIGILSSSMHRDDFSQRGMSSRGQTVLPFDVNGAHLIVVDDVLYTGRTIRAVLNELFDYGRPASVRLMVLVDRGGRELPVQADLAVARVTLPASQTLELARTDDGRFRFRLQAIQPPA